MELSNKKENKVNQMNLKLELLPSGKWQLLEPYTYVGFWGRKYEVKKGFITELASIPRAFWCFIAPTDVPYSAVIHDDLLIKLREQRITRRLVRLSAWKQANAIMYSAMALSPKKIPLWRKFFVKIAIDLNAMIKCLIFNKQPSEI